MDKIVDDLLDWHGLHAESEHHGTGPAALEVGALPGTQAPLNGAASATAAVTPTAAPVVSPEPEQEAVAAEATQEEEEEVAYSDSFEDVDGPGMDLGAAERLEGVGEAEHDGAAAEAQQSAPQRAYEVLSPPPPAPAPEAPARGPVHTRAEVGVALEDSAMAQNISAASVLSPTGNQLGTSTSLLSGRPSHRLVPALVCCAIRPRPLPPSHLSSLQLCSGR